MYVLDTCILEYARRENAAGKKVRAWIESVNETDLYISVAAIAEKMKGAQKLRAQRNKDLKGAAKLEADATQMVADWSKRILALDKDAAIHWGTMLTGQGATGLDCAVAAVAKANGYKIVTANVDDFRPHGIDIVDPVNGKNVTH